MIKNYFQHRPYKFFIQFQIALEIVLFLNLETFKYIALI